MSDAAQPGGPNPDAHAAHPAAPGAGADSRSLKLTPAQLEMFQEALMRAFPSEHELERFVYYSLGENLDNIVPQAGLEEITFDLIQWAEGRGLLPQLVEAAYARRPNNPALRGFAETVGLPPPTAKPAISAAPPRVTALPESRPVTITVNSSVLLAVIGALGLIVVAVLLAGTLQNQPNAPATQTAAAGNYQTAVAAAIQTAVAGIQQAPNIAATETAIAGAKQTAVAGATATIMALQGAAAEAAATQTALTAANETAIAIATQTLAAINKRTPTLPAQKTSVAASQTAVAAPAATGTAIQAHAAEVAATQTESVQQADQAQAATHTALAAAVTAAAGQAAAATATAAAGQTSVAAAELTKAAGNPPGPKTLSPDNVTQLRAGPPWTGHDKEVNHVAFSPEGKIVASASEDGTVRLWRVSDGVVLNTLKAEGGVRCVAFSPDGKILAAGAADHTVRLWSVPDGELLHTLTGHDNAVWGVAFFPDGNTVASAGDTTVRLWNVKDGTSIQTLDTPPEPGTMTAVAIARDGKTIAAGSTRGQIRLWQQHDSTWDPVDLKSKRSGVINLLAFSPDSTLLAAAVNDGNTDLWKLGDDTPVQTFAKKRETAQATGPHITGVVFSPDGLMIATASADSAGDANSTAEADNTVTIWRITDPTPLVSLQGHGGGVTSVDWAHNDQMLVSGSKDNKVILWTLP